MSFRCGVPECRTTIRGMTGLQELNNLRSHLRRVHMLDVDLVVANEWRERFEKQEEEAKDG